MRLHHIHLQQAQGSDLEFIQRLDEGAYKPYIVELIGSWDASYFVLNFRASEYNILIWNDLRVGFVKFAEEEDSIVINDIVISPEYRDRGIGSELLRSILALAKSKSKSVRLRVFKGNRAIHWYERFGFFLTGEDETHHSMLYHHQH